jgi:hypothetical protein
MKITKLEIAGLEKTYRRPETHRLCPETSVRMATIHGRLRTRPLGIRERIPKKRFDRVAVTN